MLPMANPCNWSSQATDLWRMPATCLHPLPQYLHPPPNPQCEKGRKVLFRTEEENRGSDTVAYHSTLLLPFQNHATGSVVDMPPGRRRKKVFGATLQLLGSIGLPWHTKSRRALLIIKKIIACMPDEESFIRP